MTSRQIGKAQRLALKRDDVIDARPFVVISTHANRACYALRMQVRGVGEVIIRQLSELK